MSNISELDLQNLRHLMAALIQPVVRCRSMQRKPQIPKSGSFLKRVQSLPWITSSS